jgi:hypothetical protein
MLTTAPFAADACARIDTIRPIDKVTGGGYNVSK